MRASTPSASVPHKAVYQDAFVQNVHRLLGMGYEKVRRAFAGDDLRRKKEPEITGRMVENMDKLIQDYVSPDWVKDYQVQEDVRLNYDEKEGIKRSYVDMVVVFRAPSGSWKFFHFEAKNIESADSISTYLSNVGLGRLLSGYYARGHEHAGMLGYVHAGACDDWATEVKNMLGQCREDHGLPPRGEYWSKRFDVPELSTSYTSSHPRAKDCPKQIHHTFLLCY